MKLNDTTRTYFEKLAGLSDPAEAAQYRNLLIPEKSAAAREYLALNEPAISQLRRDNTLRRQGSLLWLFPWWPYKPQPPRSFPLAIPC